MRAGHVAVRMTMRMAMRMAMHVSLGGRHGGAALRERAHRKRCHRSIRCTFTVNDGRNRASKKLNTLTLAIPTDGCAHTFTCHGGRVEGRRLCEFTTNFSRQHTGVPTTPKAANALQAILPVRSHSSVPNPGRVREW